MSKRTSGDILEVANSNDLSDGCDDTELSEGSNEPDSKESAAVEEVMISCIQTTSGDCSLVSLWWIL